MAGLTTAVGGWLVVKTPTGEIVGYDRLGWMAVVSGVFSVWLASRVRTVEHSIPVVAVGVTAIEVAEVVDQVKRSNG
jgi:hypothetical protein